MDTITLDMLLDSKRLQESFRTAMQQIAAPQLVALEGIIGDESKPFAMRRMAERLRDILAEILRMQGFALPGLNQSRPDQETSLTALRQLMTIIISSDTWPYPTANDMTEAIRKGDHQKTISTQLQSHLYLNYIQLLEAKPAEIMQRGQTPL